MSVAPCTLPQGLGSFPSSLLSPRSRTVHRPPPAKCVSLQTAPGTARRRGMLRYSPSRPRPHLPRRQLPPYLGFRLRQGFSAGPAALRGRDRSEGRDSGEGRAAAGPAPRRPQPRLAPARPRRRPARVPRPPSPPLRPPHLETGPVRGRRCRAAPLTIRAAVASSCTKQPAPPPRRLRLRGARLPPRAGLGRPRTTPALRYWESARASGEATS